MWLHFGKVLSESDETCRRIKIVKLVPCLSFKRRFLSRGEIPKGRRAVTAGGVATMQGLFYLEWT